MNIVQFLSTRGETQVGVVQPDGETLCVLADVPGTRDLAMAAIAAGTTLERAAIARLSERRDAYEDVVAEGRLLPPLTHSDPAHCLVTGTGLTHLGSADARDRMHRSPADATEEPLTDSMKMFRLGLEGGKPQAGETGVQPEWFYKGDGDWVAPPEQPLLMPPFALDGGEEPELAALYVIGPDGRPWRLGFALANEFSDHVMERQNYLYLGHSKLRSCSFGPELRCGPLPAHVAGRSRILRGGAELWSAAFVTGEANMSHSLANLEHHHFKYAGFRRPGDVHVHFLGTATLSFAAGIRAEPGDVFEIAASAFGRPLRNPLGLAADTASGVGVL